MPDDWQDHVAQHYAHLIPQEQEMGIAGMTDEELAIALQREYDDEYSRVI
jgi:hypothetical protein